MDRTGLPKGVDEGKDDDYERGYEEGSRKRSRRRWKTSHMHTIDTDIPSSLHRIRAASILLPGVVFRSQARRASIVVRSLARSRRRTAENSERRCYTTMVGAFVDPTRAPELHGGSTTGEAEPGTRRLVWRLIAGAIARQAGLAYICSCHKM